ncbi:sigma factor-like helix-turn-helix DNA-binding protein [Patescibacteria group bacterium]
MSNGKRRTFKELMDAAISSLSERSQEIVRARFGVSGKSCTLNEIGNNYGITRERVRQIIKESVNKVQKQENDGILEEARVDIKCTIKNNNDIIHREEILNLYGDDLNERGSVEFFLECLEDVNVVEKKGEIAKSFMDHKFDIDYWKEIKDAAKATLNKKKETLDSEGFYQEFKSEFGDNFNVTEGEFLNYLKVSGLAVSGK